jgi:DNA repair protein RadC
MTQTQQNQGHRARVKEKFLHSFGEELMDYELLEILLFAAFVRKDTKVLAKKLINKFGDISSVINADENLLREIEGVGDAVIAQLKLAWQINKRILKKSIKAKTLLNNFEGVISYVSNLLQNLNYEAFYVLFLDKKYQLIEEQLIAKGEGDFVLVSSKDVAWRALMLHASSIILAHNHPSNDLKPSNSDITTTKEIVDVLKKLQIQVLDHLIIGKSGHFSFKQNLLI